MSRRGVVVTGKLEINPPRSRDERIERKECVKMTREMFASLAIDFEDFRRVEAIRLLDKMLDGRLLRSRAEER